MIRFIDIRYRGTQHRFAFFDTVTNEFMRAGGEVAWEAWADFEECVRLPPLEEGAFPDPKDAYLARFKALVPAWVFATATEEELDFGTAEATDSYWSTEARLQRLEALLTKLCRHLVPGFQPPPSPQGRGVPLHGQAVPTCKPPIRDEG